MAVVLSPVPVKRKGADTGQVVLFISATISSTYMLVKQPLRRVYVLP